MFKPEASGGPLGPIVFPTEFDSDYEERVLQEARGIVQRRLASMDFMACPETVRDYLAIHLAGYSEEVFACLFLTACHRVIAFEVLFRGTLTRVGIHDRVIARRVLLNNAAAVVLAHNHPSGSAEPSAEDVALTEKIRELLRLLDVRLLDHFIIGGNVATSMVERGCLMVGQP